MYFFMKQILIQRKLLFVSQTFGFKKGLKYSISIEFIPPAHRTVPHRTAPKRYFAKMPLHLNVTFLTHRTMQRYIEKYAVTSIVTLNCNGKDHRYTNRYRYYRYRILKNKALQRPWQFIVTRDRDRCRIL